MIRHDILTVLKAANKNKLGHFHPIIQPESNRLLNQAFRSHFSAAHTPKIMQLY